MEIANNNKGIVRDSLEELDGSLRVVTNENLDVKSIPGVLVGIDSDWLRSITLVNLLETMY